MHLCASVQALIGDIGKVRKIVDTPALYSEPDEWIESIFEIATPFVGARPTPKTIMFSTDGADMKRGYAEMGNGSIPAVIIGPGEPSIAHQIDEWCSIKRLEESVEMYETMMRDWCDI